MSEAGFPAQRSSRLLPFYLLAAATAALMIYAMSMERDARDAFLIEGGPVEMASAALFLVGAALLASRGRALWPFAMLLLLFALREFDLDKAPFTEGVLKSRQYVGDTVGLGERIVAFIVLGGILYVLFEVIRRGWRPLWNGFLARDWRAWAVLLAGFLAVSSKSLDGVGRKLRPLGIELGEATEHIAGVYEETAEFGMALSLVAASAGFLLTTRGAGAKSATSA